MAWLPKIIILPVFATVQELQRCCWLSGDSAVVKFIRSFIHSYSTGGDTTPAATTATTTTPASATEKTESSLERDVTETRDSVRRLDSRVEELSRDVGALSTDVRTLLRALHAVLHPDDDRSRPPASPPPPPPRHSPSKTPTPALPRESEPSSTTPSRPHPPANRPRQSRQSPSKTPAQLPEAEPSTSSGPPATTSSRFEMSSRPPASFLTPRKRGSLADASPSENAEPPRLRRQALDDLTRTSCSPGPAIPLGRRRLSRGGSGSSSRDSVGVDDADAAEMAGIGAEQTYAFSDSGPPTVGGPGSRRAAVAGDWQPPAVVVLATTTTEAGGTSRPRSRALVPTNNVAGGAETLTSSPSAGGQTSNNHASVLLTTDL